MQTFTSVLRTVILYFSFSVLILLCTYKLACFPLLLNKLIELLLSLKMKHIFTLKYFNC